VLLPGDMSVSARHPLAGKPGTEDVYELYAESFRGNEHLGQTQDQAQALIKKILRGTENSQ
jgi:phosphoglucomutase